MKLKNLLEQVKDKNDFRDIGAYLRFCASYLDYISDNLQAVIVSQNENHYRFYQYKEEGNFQITRPVNSRLMYDAAGFSSASAEFSMILKHIKAIDKEEDAAARDVLNRATYTIQQSIGATLDALPAGQSNLARKRNGDLFERFIRLVLREMGIDCQSGIIRVPVIVDDELVLNMRFQHDLFIETNGEVKVVGSIKTSSKDRMDKIFLDKFLYQRLTEKSTPHIAIFLNDVQRKNTPKETEYGINATFLAGHFKAYSIKLNPLDGVYYCDIRPNMQTDPALKAHIKTLDHLLIDDIWKLL